MSSEDIIAEAVENASKSGQILSFQIARVEIEYAIKVGDSLEDVLNAINKKLRELENNDG